MTTALLNNYCAVEDVLTLIKKVETPDSLLLDRINTFINQSSRLIDDYCQTKFHEQDFSLDYLDSRFSNISIKDSSVWFPFPLSQIIEIKENDIVLAGSDYILPSGSISQVYRLNSDGELKDWSGTIKVKGKFGYKGLPSCSTGFKTLPFVIRTQCAIFTAYLLGDRKVTGKNMTKTANNTNSKTGWENRVSGHIPTIGVGGANTTIPAGIAFIPDTNIETITPKTYTGKTDIIMVQDTPPYKVNVALDTVTSLGWQAPINETITNSVNESENESGNLEGLNLEGFIPYFEFKKLDPYKFYY